MKTLKLEVGKTYRNRRCEEVKIVKNDGGVELPYQGSNGEWYTESGRWQDFGPEDPEDLIAEIPSEPTRHTFAIPDGVKEITLDYFGNRIVVEMVPEAKGPKPGGVGFKEGDIVFEGGRIMIVKEHPNLYHAMFYAELSNLQINSEYGVPFTSATFRPATPEGAQPLWDALKKAGKRWNPETMKVEDVPEVDAAERCRIMDYLQGYANNVTWNYEQLCWLIENYLKHKEAKK